MTRRNIFAKVRRRGVSAAKRPEVRGGGTLIGMSLARIMESGTRYVAAKPAFSPAVDAASDAVQRRILQGYSDAIDRFWN